MENSEELKQMISEIYRLNQLLTTDSINKASKKELREYLMLVDQLKARLRVAIEEKENK